MQNFKDYMIGHGTIYVQSTEEVIPLPSNFVDVLFTVNAIDHVDNFDVICEEILRILKSGGEFIGSFNLGEEPSLCEPQCLDINMIDHTLLKSMEVTSYRLAAIGPAGDRYQYLLNNDLNYQEGGLGCLWVRAKKL
jgi:ubiquinone/menaquinone biosynthesis C-methylase UbiE